jgi:hypothetical protein
VERALGRAAPSAGGRPTPSGRSTLLVAVLVLLAGFGWVLAAPAASATEAGVSLFDDDDGRALFTAADRLAPGTPRQACISVGARTAQAGDVVTFAATDVTGPLAEHLTVTLEAGDGGSFGDCTGFTGSTLWTGTLAALAVASAGDGLPTGWQPAVDPVRSFRVTVVLDPALTQQGLTATGDLSWRLFRDVDPTPTPTPTPTTPTPAPTPTLTPTPTPTPTDPGTPTAQPTPPTATPSPDPSPDPTPPRGGPTATPAPDPTGPPQDPGASADGEADVEIGGGLAVLRETARRAATTAFAVIAEPQYPLLAILVAVVFLAVQDLIDRRDPKLVTASISRRDAEELFPDLLAPGGGPT